MFRSAKTDSLTYYVISLNGGFLQYSLAEVFKVIQSKLDLRHI